MPYVKLREMPPLHPYSYEGPLLPLSDSSPTTVTMPTEEQMQRTFALHAANMIVGDRPMHEICEAARFIEDGMVFQAGSPDGDD